MATRVLRTIDKVGGLDEYLLGDKPARIKELGLAGWALRAKLMRTEVVRRRFEEERVRLGLPREGIGMLGLVGERSPLPRKETMAQEEEEEEEEDEEEEGEEDDEEGQYLEAQDEVPEREQQQEPVTVSRRRWNWRFWQR